jgi:hypothetical protein
MNTRTVSIRLTAVEREFFLWATLTQPRFLSFMKRNQSAKPALPTESEIQHTAYLLWIEAGRPEGCDRDNWFAAKELLAHHGGRDLRPRRHAFDVQSLDQAGN